MCYRWLIFILGLLSVKHAVKADKCHWCLLFVTQNDRSWKDVLPHLLSDIKQPVSDYSNTFIILQVTLTQKQLITDCSTSWDLGRVFCSLERWKVPWKQVTPNFPCWPFHEGALAQDAEVLLPTRWDFERMRPSFRNTALPRRALGTYIYFPEFYPFYLKRRAGQICEVRYQWQLADILRGTAA